MAVMGRPREYDLTEMAVRIEAWSQLESSIHLGDFALEQGTYPVKLYDWRDRDDDFREALARAKFRLAKRIKARLDAKECNEKLALREIGYHDELLKYNERADVEHQLDYKARADARAAAAISASPEEQQRHEALMAAIAASQEMARARNSSSADNKS